MDEALKDLGLEPGATTASVQGFGTVAQHAIELYNGGIHVTDDYRELLDDEAVDAVCIATPVRSHFSLGKEALEAGKHIFIEKPL